MYGWLIALLLAGLSPVAANATDGIGGVTEGPILARWTGDRMRLGLPADRWQGPESAPRPKNRAETCAKWRTMALRLGETFAGHTLRRTVVDSVCGMHEAERPDESWDWPWSGLAQGGLLPPRLHRAISEWEIRCGSAGSRRRCALIHQAPVPPDAVLDPGDPALVTHFVIDMVGGREVLLWRLYVPAKAESASVQAFAMDDGGSTLRPSRPDHRRAEVSYDLDRTVHIEKFPTCAERGCLMEANVMRAGSVATQLANERPLELSIKLGDGGHHRLMLPAKGFRAGLSELVRLRQEELRSQFRRKSR